MRLPVLGMVSRPPRFPSVALVLRPGSLDRVWLWKSRSLPTDLRLRISLSEHMSAGSSRDERVDELYTLILRLGNGSSRGDVVMGILCGLSLMPCCREKRGPRKVPAVAVRSGGAEGCRGLGLSIDREGVGWGGRKELSYHHENDTGRAERAKSDAGEMD